jgi:hypothetical protein
MENFDELEQEIAEEMRKVYSPQVIEHFQNPGTPLWSTIGLSMNWSAKD